MPLYKYVVTYKNGSYVAQARHSNFKGFASAWADLPPDALPLLTPHLKKELSQKCYTGDFLPVPNRTNVWRKAFEIGGSELQVYAIQTES